MHIPLIIVGGGIVGLTIAYDLRKKFPDLEFALLEKGPFLGEHSTSRNSGVLHAGLYYNQGSLKQKLCLEGRELWNTLADELNIQIKKCGKFIVSNSEDGEIEKLFNHATDSGVKDLSWCEASGIPKVINATKAFFSKNTAILDVPTAIKSLDLFLTNHNVPILLNNSVKSISYKNRFYQLKTENESISCDYLINAAGGFSIDLRKQLGLTDLQNYLVKGSYLKLSGKYYNQSLIYPLPELNLKGLGVHTSFTTDGVIRFGPNHEETPSINYEINPNLIEEMYPSINKIFQNITPERLSLDYSGVRSKIKYNGALYSDFWIKEGSSYGLPGYIDLCGIESPGLTSAPAISRYVLKHFLHF